MALGFGDIKEGAVDNTTPSVHDCAQLYTTVHNVLLDSRERAGGTPLEAAWEAEHDDLCSVPQCWADDPLLGSCWVDTQRQYKKALTLRSSGGSSYI
jgi:hypothetical protein